MREDPESYKVSVEVGLRQDPARLEPHRSRPFDILVLGDFSGRASRRILDPDAALRTSEPIRVDADNVLSLAGLTPVLDLPADLQDEEKLVEASRRSQRATLLPSSLAFNHLEDFHPDQLARKIPALAALRAADPIAGAGRDGAAEPSLSAEPPERAPGSASPPPSGGAVLDAILSDTGGMEGSGSTIQPDSLESFIRRVVSPHLVPEERADVAEARRRLQVLEAGLLRHVLHHPRLQELEALWRALFFLVARSGPDAELGLHLLDVSKAEIAADAGAHADVLDTALQHAITKSPAGRGQDARWALVIGGFSYGSGSEDLAVLFQLGALAHLAETPVVCAAEPSLAGFVSFASSPVAGQEGSPPAWEAFRRSGFAQRLGLVTPRFLLRLPYGKDTDPVESLPFEELGEDPSHEQYLWGNPAFVVGALMAQSFREGGWAMSPERHLELSGLPLHVPGSGGAGAQPCAEALLTDRNVSRILERGIMPLRSMKGADLVHLARMQSVAYPPRALEAWWGR